MFPRELGSGASSDSPAARLSSEFSLPSPILPQSNPNTFHPRNVSRETTAAGAAATSSRSRRQQRAGAQIPIPSSLASGRNQSHEDGDGDGDEDATSEDDTTFLCLYYTRGKLGAALYSLDSASLALLPTVSDMGPDFKVAKALLYQTDPRHVLICSSQPKPFVEVVKHACGVEEEATEVMADPGEDENDEEEGGGDAETHITADQDNGVRRRENGDGEATTSPRPERQDETSRDSALRNTRLHIMSGKCFGFRSCQRRIVNIRLPRETANVDEMGRLHFSEEEHMLLINSLVDLNSESGVRATGALLKFMDANRAGVALNLDAPDSNCMVMEIKSLCLEDVVNIDETTFTALQIFSSGYQPTAGAKFGSWNKKREGLSLFSIVNNCKSVLGAKYLRYMFRCPPRSLDTILQRQEVIAYFANPAQNDLVKMLQGSLRYIKNIPHLLKKLATTQATVKDWKCFRKSIHSLVNIGEIASSERDNVSILKNIREATTGETHYIADYIDNVMDLESSLAKGKFAVNSGVDEDLDHKRRIHNGLPDLLLRVAREEIHDLPEYMTECTMSYVPQIGYILVVQPWTEEEITEEALEAIEELEFLFSVEGVPHFKTRRCRELDETLGDTATNISEHETSIMMQLIRYILARTDFLLAPTRYAALLDSLIALAAAAIHYNWRRPYVSDQVEAMHIQNGRHPLQELCSPTFVPNDTRLGETARMAILTGPNACGKSVYLKQVGLIAFLAHIGSWVPAEAAVIPLMDKISTRIHTIESMSLGLSAFMVDVNQISSAVRASTSRSLLLVDEFGKGTAEVDGQALLAASLRYLLNNDRDRCPITLVSTHFHNIKSLLSGEDRVTYNTFDLVEEQDEIIHLYKLKPGSCKSSQAHVVARMAGLGEEVVQRSFEVLNSLREGSVIAANPDIYPMDECVALAEAFLEVDLADKEQLETLFEKLRGSSLYDDNDEVTDNVASM